MNSSQTKSQDLWKRERQRDIKRQRDIQRQSETERQREQKREREDMKEHMYQMSGHQTGNKWSIQVIYIYMLFNLM